MAPIPVVIPAPTPKASKSYVLKADIDRYGETPGCPGCAQVFVAGETEVPHNEECQARIFEMTARDGDGKAQAR